MSELSVASSNRPPMRRSVYRLWAAVVAVVLALVFVATPSAQAQDIDQIVQELEDRGYYLEPGGDGTDGGFADLVRQAEDANDTWYFVSMASTVDPGFADTLFEAASPKGNVLVYFIDGDFVEVQLASDASASVEANALEPFDGQLPQDFMGDVVTRFDELTGTTSSSGGGFPWLLVGIPVVLIGGFWFMSRRGKKEKAEASLETAQEIRAELQTELDELANDVLVLSEPIDLSDKKEAINYYREATDSYLDISDELPDVEKLEDADLRELSELGTRVAHARWQMDAAEAILDGEPVPEKPKVAPPPPVAPAPEVQQRRNQQRRQMPQRQPRARVPYSRSRRRSGGGLLDILIAGAGMTAGRGGGMFGGGSRSSSRGGGMFGGGSRSSSRGGGMFGGGSRSNSRGRTQTTQRPRGGVFGRSSGSRSTGSRSTGSRTSTRRSSSSRSRSGSSRSTSRRRPRSRR